MKREEKELSDFTYQVLGKKELLLQQTKGKSEIKEKRTKHNLEEKWKKNSKQPLWQNNFINQQWEVHVSNKHVLKERNNSSRSLYVVKTVTQSNAKNQGFKKGINNI